MLQEAGGEKGHTNTQFLTIKSMIMQQNNSLVSQAIFLRRDVPNSLISFFSVSQTTLEASAHKLLLWFRALFMFLMRC